MHCIFKKRTTRNGFAGGESVLPSLILGVFRKRGLSTYCASEVGEGGEGCLQRDISVVQV